VIEETIQTSTHGRYLVHAPAGAGPAPLLVGFHGYGEDAESQLHRLRAIPGSNRWLLVSIQALHRFYHRQSNAVVASWMTRQDRELAIDDNTAYVSATLGAVAEKWPTVPRAVFAGFSQGVAMAFRAAAGSPALVSGVVAVGGDVPPEIGPSALGRLPRALVCRGTRDDVYGASTFAADLRRLQESGVAVERCEFDGAHEWSRVVNDAASRFLQQSYGSQATAPTTGRW
jgi:predicted esterase